MASKNNSTGGAIYMQESNSEISGCTFSGNSASGGSGGAVGAVGGQPSIRGCTFLNNITGQHGGAIYSYNAQPKISDCTFDGNTADFGGAILIYQFRSIISASSFLNNSARSGGAIGASNADVYLKNSLFAGNSSETGGVVHAVDDPPGQFGSLSWLDVLNCTFADNGSTAIAVSNVQLDVKNSILWNPLKTEISNPNSRTNVHVDYSNIEGGLDDVFGVDLGGNINADPKFVDPESGDFRLLPGSPCIDAGTDYAPRSDINGVNRPLGDGIDMGAYEFIDFDINGDGVTDASDIQLVINAALGFIIAPFDADINGDGAIDAVDIQLTTNAALGL